VPVLPGFIAAVNTSVMVADGATELYYINYLFGFLVSGLVFIVLHKVFPSQQLDAFVRQTESPEDTVVWFQQKWDDTDHETTSAITGSASKDDEPVFVNTHVL
jgi:nucleobase:cation symporter-1, NCS1 family